MRLGFGIRGAGPLKRLRGTNLPGYPGRDVTFGMFCASSRATRIVLVPGPQELAQCAGQHILLDVQGAVLALVVRQ